MYFTYLRRELSGRKKQSIIVAIGLAVAIALVMVVNALSGGVSQAQAQALSSVYGVGTDLTVTGSATQPGDGQRGQRFDFGSGAGETADGTTSLSSSRLMTDMMRGTLDATTVATVAATDGVAAATGTLSLTNTTFSGELPDFSQMQQNPGTTDGGDGDRPRSSGGNAAAGRPGRRRRQQLRGRQLQRAGSGPGSDHRGPAVLGDPHRRAPPHLRGR
ncbi:hypothetical protein [Microbacterium nymphoidis]|uniref:hypothetical protein n=1 Tax=Microbacterium nymphoidis TaxID=2898586 RepID=UPI001E3F6F88|nr:hypothetical protein [Microbacterium nymphoidis]MCD2499474.1 hypothetical protein [Microbacterium nymphoidis]